MSNTRDFINAKNELRTEEIINSIYQGQKSVMSGVLSVIPFLGSVIDKSCDQAFERYQTRKRDIFVNTVLSNVDIITSDKVRNESFIINIAKTIELVDRCTSNDKIVCFGNLVRNGYFETDTCISNDDFDEYEAILKDLSDREIKYLVVFAERARKNNYSLTGEKLEQYYDEMLKLYPKINPQIMLNRLKRTGFVSDQMALAEFGNEEESAEALVFNNSNAFILDKGFDDFERIVLGVYDTGSRI